MARCGALPLRGLGDVVPWRAGECHQPVDLCARERLERLRREMLETDPDNLEIFFELPTSADHTGTSVSQKHTAFSAPTTLTERMVAVVQEHSENDNLRVFVFRQAKPTPESMEIMISKDEASAVPVEFELEADTDVADADGPFGMLYRETAS